MSKKIIAVITALFLLLIPLSNLSYANNNTDIVNKYKILNALGFFNDDSPDNYEGSTSVSRGKFVTAAVRALPEFKDYNFSAENSGFSDVSSNNSYAKGIIIAKHLGLINDSGKFYPDKPIKLEEATAILVRLVGYQIKAQSKGGAPGDYAATASELGITKEVKRANKSFISEDDAIIMLYNMLDVEVLEKVGFGNNIKYESKKGKTFITERLDVYKGTDVVTANCNTSLTGKGLRKGYVEIGGLLLQEGNLQTSDFLGYKVLYYYHADKKDDSNLELLYIEKSSSNDELIINSEYITEFSDNKYTYCIDNGKTKSVTIGKDIQIIYNGKCITSPFNGYIPGHGEIKLINYDGNDYDVLIISEYENYVVDNIDKSNYIITDMYDGSKTIPLLSDNNAKKVYLFNSNGKPFNYYQVKRWNVLSVYKSQDGNIINTYLTDNSIEGSVDEKSDDNITVNGIKYNINGNFNFKINDYGVFYLDYMGNIAAFDKKTSIGRRSGYLVKLRIKEGVGQAVMFKVFSDNNKFEVFEGEKNLKINGEIISDADTAISKIKQNGEAKQLILFEISKNGKIAEVLTAKPYSLSLSEQDNTGFRQISKSQQYLGHKLTNFDNVYRHEANATRVFIVPSNIENETMFEYYGNSADYFKFNKYYYLTGFNENGNMPYCEYIISHVGTSEGSSDYFDLLPIVIEKVSKIIDENGEDTFKIYGYNANGEISYPVKKNDSMKNLELNSGDVICASINQEGKIDSINKMFDGNLLRTMGKNPSSPTANTQWRYLFANVYSNWNGTLQVSVKNPAELTSKQDIEQLFSNIYKTIYKFDTKSKKVEKGEAGLIRDYLNNPSNYSKVFSFTSFSDPTFLVIYE